MDVLRLLSRGSKGKKTAPLALVPSAQESKPQLFAASTSSRKRKRGEASLRPSENTVDFFDQSSAFREDVRPDDEELEVNDEQTNSSHPVRSMIERKSVLKQHKIKVNLLQKQRPLGGDKSRPKLTQLYPEPIQRFDELSNNDYAPKWLVRNLAASGFSETTEIQMVALSAQLVDVDSSRDDSQIASRKLASSTIDLLTVAPTGSGKTLAFLIPTMVRIWHHRSQFASQSRYTAVIILAPTKELVDQIVNDGRRLAERSGIRISRFRKGMLLASHLDSDEETHGTQVKSDILVSTPGLLCNTLETTDEHAELLRTVRYLVLDEADVLLDPLFREQTVGIWQRLKNPDLSVALWSATMGSNIEELTQQIIKQRRRNILASTGTRPPERPLVRIVVGLKDSAVPNVEHKLIYAATEQGKLMGLRQLLHPVTASVDSAPSLRPPFIIFTQTIERAIALHAELLYDIPAVAGGISRIAVLHSDLVDTSRENVMTRFRKGDIWVLITTDLLSRGIDFRGVNGVVNYDIPSSSAAYVHRVGRTGRAGRQGGVAVTLYSKEDIPYLKHVANVIAAAQREQGVSDGGVQKWLLDALPTLSKNEKQRLKKRGVEVRASRAMASDAKAARRARISTKAGYDRKEENRKKQAIASSKRRAKAVDDFGGFDS